MTIRPTPPGGPFHFPYQRILVTGANGAGKTWVASQLAHMLDLPCQSNDAFALSRNWAYRPKAEVRAAQALAIAQPAWVLEGGPSLVRADILARTDVVIWLDPPRSVRLFRIIRRTLRYLGRTRPEHPLGNAEWPGRRQIGFVIKAWRNDAQVRTHLVHLADGQTPYLRLRTRTDVATFLTTMRRQALSGVGELARQSTKSL